MAEADPKMITEPAAHGVAEEVMASSASDSGEESDSNSSSSTSSCSSSSSSNSSGSSSSSSSGSSSSSSSSSASQVYRKKRVPEPSRRAQRHPSGKYFMDKLPQAVRNRVQALRNIQDECDKVDTLFLRAIHDLERKYAELNKPLYDKRFQIINAEYEPTEEECEWNSDEEFSGDEEMQDDTPNEMPPLEGEEEEESCKEKTEVKEEEKDVPKEVPAAKVEENKAPEEIPEVKTEEKEIPKEVPEEIQEKEATEEILEVKADEKEASKEIPEVKFEEKEASEEIPQVKFEEKEASEEIPEVKFEEKADSTDYIEITPEEKEDPKGVPQANAENKDQPTEESKARAPVREAQKRVPETSPEEGGKVKRARKRKPKREDPKGIPDYWLTVLKNVDKLGPMIQKYDEPILKFLSDVSLKFSNPGQPISYTFEFHFLPNPYFRNEFLVKTYIIRSKPDHYDPFFAWGWEIEECKGCKIDWRRGKDVTVKTTQSRPAATGETEVQPRVVRNASFFNFFSPPEIPLIGKLEPREDAILDEDFEIGQILHDNVILKSIFYFTGEINDPYYHDVKDYGNRKYYK